MGPGEPQHKFAALLAKLPTLASSVSPPRLPSPSSHTHAHRHTAGQTTAAHTNYANSEHRHSTFWRCQPHADDCDADRQGHGGRAVQHASCNRARGGRHVGVRWDASAAACPALVVPGCAIWVSCTPSTISPARCPTHTSIQSASEDPPLCLQQAARPDKWPSAAAQAREAGRQGSSAGGEAACRCRGSCCSSCCSGVAAVGAGERLAWLKVGAATEELPPRVSVPPPSMPSGALMAG